MKTKLKETQQTFPISSLSELTGVNSVTLRAWERRYGLLKPKRSAKGHRYYDHHDLETVKNILAWIDKGVAVGKVKPLLQQSEALNENSVDAIWLEYQNEFMQAGDTFNENKIESLYKKITKQYPLRACVEFCFFPLFEVFETQPNTSAGQHFLFNAIKQRMNLTLLAINKKIKKQEPVVFFAHASQSSWKVWLAALLTVEKSLYTLVFEDVNPIHSIVAITNGMQACAVVLYSDAKLIDLDFNALELLDQKIIFRISGTDIWLNQKNKIFDNIRSNIVYSPLDVVGEIINNRGKVNER